MVWHGGQWNMHRPWHMNVVPFIKLTHVDQTNAFTERHQVVHVDLTDCHESRLLSQVVWRVHVAQSAGTQVDHAEMQCSQHAVHCAFTGIEHRLDRRQR